MATQANMEDRINSNLFPFNDYTGMGGGLAAGGLAAGGLAAAGLAILSQIKDAKKTNTSSTPLLDKNHTEQMTKPGITDEYTSKPPTEELIPGIHGETISTSPPPLTKPGITDEYTSKPPTEELIPGIHEEAIGSSPLPITKPGTIEKEEIIPPAENLIPGIQNEIKDETNTNQEVAITPTMDMQSMYDFIMQQQQRQWDREDEIRRETQEREDNAWQRAVADMRKAGVNPNLVNANPAESGGGITSATGLDYSPWTAEINKQLALMEQEIQNSFQGDENAKDRFTKGLTSLLQLFTMFALKG